MSDPITTWLNAAGRYPVLSHEQTIYIARRIQAAEKDTPERIKWVNKLCLHNLRFAAKITRSYMMGGRNLNWNGDRTEDYLQVAYLGLRRAAEKFDPTLGYTFTTYANAWVRQALGRYHVENLSAIRVPESSAREIFFYDRHGKPRNEKAAQWVADASKCAMRAYGLSSYDAHFTDADGSMSDFLSDENRLIDSSESEAFDGISRVDTQGIMSALGIEPRVQDLVIAYIQRGNLDTVMMKAKCCNSAMRKSVRSAIKQIQEYTGATR